MKPALKRCHCEWSIGGGVGQSVKVEWKSTRLTLHVNLEGIGVLRSYFSLFYCVVPEIEYIAIVERNKP